MARGARATYDAQAANTTTLQNKLTSIADSVPTDVTPEERAAAKRAALGGIDEEFGLARERARGYAARTGATAGIPEMEEESAREAARQKSQADTGVTLDLMNLPVQRRLAQAGILNPALSSSTNIQGNLTSAAFRPSPLWNVLGSAMTAAGTAASGSIGGCWIANLLYGEHSAKAVQLRFWMNGYMTRRLWGKVFFWLYKRFGERVANYAVSHEWLQRVLRPIFDVLYGMCIAELNARKMGYQEIL